MTDIAGTEYTGRPEPAKLEVFVTRKQSVKKLRAAVELRRVVQSDPAAQSASESYEALRPPLYPPPPRRTAGEASEQRKR